jgi:hypothetical protein
MATKCIVIGKEKPTDQKPIEFKLLLSSKFELCNTQSYRPSQFETVELVCEGYNESDPNPELYDLIFAVYAGSPRSAAILFLGQWNDGVV